MALSVEYAEAGSPGALAGSIGWINYGAGFIILPGETITIENYIPQGDGYYIRFDLSLEEVPDEGIGIEADTSPLYDEVAFGNTGYIGISGNIILYTEAYPNPFGELLTFYLTFSNIVVINSKGQYIRNYSIVAAEAEQVNLTEIWTAITQGSPWIKIDTLPSVTGNNVQYGITGDGSNIASINGVTVQGQGDGNVPSAVFLTQSPPEIQVIFGTFIGRQAVAIGVIIDEEPQVRCNCIKCRTINS